MTAAHESETAAAHAAAVPKEKREASEPADAAGSGADSDEGEPAADGVDNASKKKKKKKPKKKKKSPNYRENGGGVPPEGPAPAAETLEEAAKWEAELKPGARRVALEPWGVLMDRLDLLRTPSCAAFALRTPRLILRQVAPGDTTAIRRIKMEPVVQKTQLYGSPSSSDVKLMFQQRYVASSIPRLQEGAAWRDEYVFAITAKDPAALAVAPAGQVRLANRVTNAEGYLGNFALSLDVTTGTEALRPRRGVAWTHPRTAECAAAGLVGKMFYEIHPQLWGQGIVSEAFAEVLRFAIEEVGCTAVSADPTSGNDASIRLCTKNGMRFTHESADNSYRRPQLFHSITADEWFARNRGGARRDAWGGKEVCRWCFDMRRAPPACVCRCGWAKYCSRECQRADWVFAGAAGGHQRECK